MRQNTQISFLRFGVWNFSSRPSHRKPQQCDVIHIVPCPLSLTSSPVCAPNRRIRSQTQCRETEQGPDFVLNRCSPAGRPTGNAEERNGEQHEPGRASDPYFCKVSWSVSVLSRLPKWAENLHMSNTSADLQFHCVPWSKMGTRRDERQHLWLLNRLMKRSLASIVDLK